MMTIPLHNACRSAITAQNCRILTEGGNLVESAKSKGESSFGFAALNLSDNIESRNTARRPDGRPRRLCFHVLKQRKEVKNDGIQ